MIPKIIHYCWFGKKKMPYKFRRYIKKWKKLSPDYEIKLWNEKNYDLNKVPFVKTAAEKGKWAFVTDYLRMDVLYRFGGIYLDTDVEMLKPFDNLLKLEAFCGFECSDYVNFGSAVGAEPNNKIIKEMLDYFEALDFTDDVLKNNTGPIVQTKILVKHGLKAEQNGTEQIVEGFHVFPQEYFCPMNYSQILEKFTENTYSIHHFAASWFSRKERRAFLWNNFKTRLKHKIKRILKYKKKD
mgnify:CR=1 FL=1